LHTHNFRALVVLVCLAVLGTTVVHAQDNNLSRAYHAVPKAGMAAQFEAALSAHTQWRKDNGDPWTWGVSVYDTGEHFGTYSVFSGGHSWADFDAYDAGFGPRGLLHWRASVAPLVESVTSIITAANMAISKPPTSGKVTVVTVTRFPLRQGQEQRFDQLISQATDIAREDLKGYWIWRSPATGGGPGAFRELIQLHAGWSGMQDPDPSFAEIMSEKMGQDGFQSWMSEFRQTHGETEVTTHRTRPDLAATAAN
jgi:hypothetical protein